MIMMSASSLPPPCAAPKILRTSIKNLTVFFDEHNVCVGKFCEDFNRAWVILHRVFHVDDVDHVVRGNGMGA